MAFGRLLTGEYAPEKKGCEDLCRVRMARSKFGGLGGSPAHAPGRAGALADARVSAYVLVRPNVTVAMYFGQPAVNLREFLPDEAIPQFKMGDGEAPAVPE